VAKQRAKIDGRSIKQLASIGDMGEADDQVDQLLSIEDNEEISDFDLEDLTERSSGSSHDEDILNDLGSSAEEHTSSDPQMSEDQSDFLSQSDGDAASSIPEDDKQGAKQDK